MMHIVVAGTWLGGSNVEPIAYLNDTLTAEELALMLIKKNKKNSRYTGWKYIYIWTPNQIIRYNYIPLNYDCVKVS